MIVSRMHVCLIAAIVAGVSTACTHAPEGQPSPVTTAAAGSRDATIDPTSQQAYPAVRPAGTPAGHPIEVRVEVSADGAIQDVALTRSSGSRALDIAAMEAARRWTYIPALANGKPVAAAIRVAVPFDD